PFRDLGFATVDSHRELRQGVPEVIFGEGKSGAQILTIARALLEAGQNVLVTRLDESRARELSEAVADVRYNPLARVARIEPTAPRARPAAGVVAVVTGGTSDLPVAEEACETVEAIGLQVERLFDVGVAGIPR